MDDEAASEDEAGIPPPLFAVELADAVAVVAAELADEHGLLLAKRGRGIEGA